nr:hypothetical protein [uncultured Arsenicibacter sp.]
MITQTAKTKAFLFALLFGFGLIVRAQSVPENVQMAVFPAREPLKFWLIIDKPETEKNARIELVNGSKQRLYIGMLSKKKQQISQLFNLSDVNDGVYTLRIVTQSGTYEKSVTVKTPAPVPQQTQRTITFDQQIKVAYNAE